MKNRKRLEEKLKKELEQCWYLPSEEKDYWLKNISELPDHTLKNVLDEISSVNQEMDKNIQAAIDADPEKNYLKELKTKINKIKKKAFDLEEESSKEKLDEDLEKQIENL